MQVNRSTTRRFLFVVTALAMAAAILFSPSAKDIQAAEGIDQVYSDAILWDNWSWGTTLTPSTTWPIHSGIRSMGVAYSRGWAGASFHSGTGVGTAGYTHLQFALHPNGNPLPKLRVTVHNGSGFPTGSVGIGSYTKSSSGGWHIVSIPLTALNAANTTATRVTIQEAAGYAQPKFYVDGLGFLKAATAADTYVYADGLAWDDWSWGSSITTNATWPIHSGSRSMAVTYNGGWAGASFHKDGGLNLSPYSQLAFAVNPNGKPLPKMTAALYGSSGSVLKKVSIASYAKSAAGGWYTFSIPLTDLNASNTTVTRVAFQEAAGSAKPTFHLDSVRFTGSGSSSGTTTVPKPTGSFRPPQAPAYIDEEVRNAVARYNLPRWFYYAIIQRESSFIPDLVGEGYPPDYGLTQLGNYNYWGMPYPQNLSVPNNNHTQYGYDMGFRKFGMWIKMDEVSVMTDPFDPKQNLSRFSDAYAVRAFQLFKGRYGLSDNETLRMVAFHWNKGVHIDYDPKNTDYLALYDKYVADFRPKVEAQDGVWNGKPYLP